MTKSKKHKTPETPLKSGSFEDIEYKYIWRHLRNPKRTHIKIKGTKKIILAFRRWLTVEEIEVSLYSWMCGNKRGVRIGKQQLAAKIISKTKLELD